ncbi:hypothetical protein AB0L40_05020 [Patulibacter sp. NPDC049589]|uniref:hypothetical protein n=1 Tax=Patulibacter sp. NPDC049589 TaxID=3154731 RepID=UPI0034259752
MARPSDPTNPVDRTASASGTSPVDRFLASTPAAAAGRPAGGPVARGVARQAELRSALLGGRPSLDGAGDWTIRTANAGDGPALARLADLDSATRIPSEPVLLAEVAGTPVAAIGILDRRVIADPWIPTAAAVDLLQANAAELRGAARRRAWAERLRRPRRGAERRARVAG